MRFAVGNLDSKMREVVEWHEQRDELDNLQLKCRSQNNGIRLLYRLGKGGELREHFEPVEAKLHPEKQAAFVYANFSKLVGLMQKLQEEKKLFYRSRGGTIYLFGKKPAAVKKARVVDW